MMVHEAATEPTMCQEGHLPLDHRGPGWGVSDSVEGGCTWSGRERGPGSWIWQRRSEEAGTRGPSHCGDSMLPPKQEGGGAGNAVSAASAVLTGSVGGS